MSRGYVYMLRCADDSLFERIVDAFAREKQIQNWSRSKRIALIDRVYADLPELAERYSTKRRRARLAQEAEERGGSV